MSLHHLSHLVVLALLAAGVLVEFLCSLGVLLMRNPFDRMHYLGPAAVVAPPLLMFAVLLEKGLAQDGIKAILIAAILATTGPILTNALGQAARVRQFGDMDVRPTDRVDAP